MYKLIKVFGISVLSFVMALGMIVPASADELNQPVHYENDYESSLETVDEFDSFGKLKERIFYDNDVEVARSVYLNDDIKIVFSDENIKDINLVKVNDNLIIDEFGDTVLEISDKKMDAPMFAARSSRAPIQPYSNDGGYYWTFEKTVKFKSPSASAQVGEVVATAAVGSLPGLGFLVTIISSLAAIDHILNPSDPVYVVVDYFHSLKQWIAFTSRFYRYDYYNGLLKTEYSPIYRY